MSPQSCPAVFTFQVLATFLALTCLLAGVQSYSLIERYDTPCPKNSLAWCMRNVENTSSDREFCNEAHSASTCIGRVYQSCKKHGLEFLQALSVVDLPAFYNKKEDLCH